MQHIESVYESPRQKSGHHWDAVYHGHREWLALRQDFSIKSDIHRHLYGLLELTGVYVRHVRQEHQFFCLLSWPQSLGYDHQ